MNCVGGKTQIGIRSPNARNRGIELRKSDSNCARFQSQTNAEAGGALTLALLCAVFCGLCVSCGEPFAAEIHSRGAENARVSEDSKSRLRRYRRGLRFSSRAGSSIIWAIWDPGLSSFWRKRKWLTKIYPRDCNGKPPVPRSVHGLIVDVHFRRRGLDRRRQHERHQSGRTLHEHAGRDSPSARSWPCACRWAASTSWSKLKVVYSNPGHGVGVKV